MIYDEHNCMLNEPRICEECYAKVKAENAQLQKENAKLKTELQERIASQQAVQTTNRLQTEKNLELTKENAELRGALGELLAIQGQSAYTTGDYYEKYNQAYKRAERALELRGGE